MTEKLLDVWERYWCDLSDKPGAAPWDSDPRHAASAHVSLFEPYFDPDLPLLDIGCGTGTQTRHLAQRYARVIGVDHAPAAVGRARAADPEELCEYRVLNLLDEETAASLRAELGDVNVYMRGVLHQMLAEQRAPMLTAVALAIGARGHFFDTELVPEAGGLIRSLMADPVEPSPKIRRILDYQLTPAAWSTDEHDASVRAAGLVTVAAGTNTLTTTERLADGSTLVVPTSYIIARNANAGDAER